MVHNKDGTDHASVTKGGTATSGMPTRRKFLRLRKRAVRLSFNISHHACLMVSRDGSSSSKVHRAVRRLRDTEGGIGWERVGAYECASDDGGNGQK
jgi:hypothetical protein